MLLERVVAAADLVEHVVEGIDELARLVVGPPLGALREIAGGAHAVHRLGQLAERARDRALQARGDERGRPARRRRRCERGAAAPAAALGELRRVDQQAELADLATPPLTMSAVDEERAVASACSRRWSLAAARPSRRSSATPVPASAKSLPSASRISAKRTSGMRPIAFERLARRGRGPRRRRHPPRLAASTCAVASSSDRLASAKRLSSR